MLRGEVRNFNLKAVEWRIGGAQAGPMPKLGKSQPKMEIGLDPPTLLLGKILFFTSLPLVPIPFTLFNPQFLHPTALGLKFLTSPLSIKIAHFSRDPESARDRT